jgi:hypothetical protein
MLRGTLGIASDHQRHLNLSSSGSVHTVLRQEKSFDGQRMVRGSQRTSEEPENCILGLCTPSTKTGEVL